MNPNKGYVSANVPNMPCLAYLLIISPSDHGKSNLDLGRAWAISGRISALADNAWVVPAQQVYLPLVLRMVLRGVAGQVASNGLGKVSSSTPSPFELEREVKL